MPQRALSRGCSPFEAVPTARSSTGGYAFHGVNEFIPVSSLEKMVDVLEALVKRFA